jgi:hypothetical protein
MGAVTIPDRVLGHVWSRIEVRDVGECWPATWSRGSHTYTQIGWVEDGRRSATTAHRAAWTSFFGPIPDGMTIDHLCRVHECCNPFHMRLLTNEANGRDNVQANRGPGLRSYKEAATTMTRDELEAALDDCELIRWWDTGVRVIDGTLELRYLVSIDEGVPAESLTFAAAAAFVRTVAAVERATVATPGKAVL